MITKNYIHIISCGGFLGSTMSENSSGWVGQSAIKDYTGKLVTCANGSDSFNDNGNGNSLRLLQSYLFYPLTPTSYTFELGDDSVSQSGSYVYLGSGKTEPTYDDYTLESVIPVSKLKVKSMSKTRQYDFKTLCDINIIVENVSTEDIDVSEIGLFAFLYKSTMPPTREWYLLARDTFDTITMKPGEIRSFVMTIK